MTPLRIGACLMVSEIAEHRDWLFSAPRDIEIQDLIEPGGLDGDMDALVASARAALDGHTGRLGVHGPFYGLDIDNRDPVVRPVITKRYLKALDVCEALGATQMVLHSPFNAWHHHHVAGQPKYREWKAEDVGAVMGPVIDRARDAGVTLVIENIEDVEPMERRWLAEALDPAVVKVSLDTGHAHLSRHMSGAPPVDFFVKAAGEMLDHVHLQDVDGPLDRHWAIGDGTIPWRAVFAALAKLGDGPRLVLELKHKSDIPRSFAYLEELGLAC